MRMVEYRRVSTTEQADSGAGLGAQRAAIELAASCRDWELVAAFEDHCSGKSMKNRSGLESAIRMCESGAADGLVVSKLDRLSRSLLDFAGLMEQAKKAGWSLVALDLGVDTGTPAGEMLASVLMTFAQFERRMIGVRTKEGLAVKRAQGVRLGRPAALPAEIRDRIFRMREEGLGFTATANILNAEGVATAHGGAKWHPSTVRTVLASQDPR